MNKLSIILFFLISISSFGQTKYLKGDGLVSVNLESFPTIELFKEITDIEPTQTIKVYDDKEIKSFNIESLESIRKEWFKPIHFHLDYFIFYFQCSVIEKDWYQVVVNEQTNLKYWVKKSSDLEFIQWEKFISGVTAVRPIQADDNPIRQEPKINSKPTNHQLIDCLSPVEVQGDWMKVKVEPAVCDKTFEMEGQEFVEGFIKWKNDKKLLIHYWLLL